MSQLSKPDSTKQKNKVALHQDSQLNNLKQKLNSHINKNMDYIMKDMNYNI
jgi:hypothetical protein